MKCQEIRSVVAFTSAPELPTAETTPVPQGRQSRALFVVGAIGCIINTLAAIWFSFTTFAFPIFGYRFSWIIGYVLLVIGLILASVGYFGMRRNYDSGVGTAGFAVGIVVGVLFLLLTVWEIMMYLFVYPTIAYELRSYILSTIYDIFFVLIILWGVAHIVTKRFTGKSGLSMATGIMLILTAVFLQIWNTVWIVGVTFSAYRYYWLWDILELIWTLLFFVSEILATILFLMAKVPRLLARPAT